MTSVSKVCGCRARTLCRMVNVYGICRSRLYPSAQIGGASVCISVQVHVQKGGALADWAENNGVRKKRPYRLKVSGNFARISRE